MRATVLAVGALSGLMTGTQVHAQDSVEGVDAQGPKPAVWIERRVTVGQTLSTNGNLSSTNARSEQITEVTPGIRAVFNTPRVQGFLDYSLSALYYAQGTSGNQFRNALNASAQVNAWDNRAFIDLSGVISNQAISAFGPQSVNGRSDTNQSETASFRFSPYLRGSFAGNTDYELRYSLQTANTNTAARSDITDQAASMRLGSRNTGQTLGWSLNASSGATTYSRGRDTESSSAQGGLIIAATPQVQVTLLAGVESNDIISLQKETYNTSGINVEWRPSERTRLFVGVENRYFGTGHNIALEHRTGQTLWRYTDTRGVVNNPLQGGADSLGSSSDALLRALLDNQFRSETNDIRRAQLVEAAFTQLKGSGVNTSFFQNFLTSSATLDRVQRLSVALSGIRSVWTLSAFRSDSSRLDSFATGVDDFAFNTDIQQQGWSLNFAHRLTPLSSFNAALTNQKSVGSSGLNLRSTTVSLGLSTRLSRQTSGSVQLQRANYSGTSGPYNDTAISGFITHRF
ncbi:TIGR03016 family PEP-CTERM system-associated outer membrane protein [Hydrogenophaga sp.]|uniref:TIGR03016 family PEP-CTERM system-associated outer membrane protein n=1 Tax=Hydrogenophaga sp. TaxID=1904254 RepID=UPI0027313B12|nr:TIGR03016 family PEP-CTERM system-associated outer membrane protein [Hydrogenophaga sp.]MDP1684457.1 TIGR03016 family PEP-CTERM system-associated outer membrane protein [Hydrogenophaga sp.]